MRAFLLVVLLVLGAPAKADRSQVAGVWDRTDYRSSGSCSATPLVSAIEIRQLSDGWTCRWRNNSGSTSDCSLVSGFDDDEIVVQKSYYLSLNLKVLGDTLSGNDTTCREATYSFARRGSADARRADQARADAQRSQAARLRSYVGTWNRTWDETERERGGRCVYTYRYRDSLVITDASSPEYLNAKLRRSEDRWVDDRTGAFSKSCAQFSDSGGIRVYELELRVGDKGDTQTLIGRPKLVECSGTKNCGDTELDSLELRYKSPSRLDVSDGEAFVR